VRRDHLVVLDAGGLQCFLNAATRVYPGAAFVAVADDATASWWNPAGLARGAFFSSQVEYGSMRQPDTDRDATGLPRSAWQNGVRAIAVG